MPGVSSTVATPFLTKASAHATRAANYLRETVPSLLGSTDTVTFASAKEAGTNFKTKIVSFWTEKALPWLTEMGISIKSALNTAYTSVCKALKTDSNSGSVNSGN